MAEASARTLCRKELESAGFQCREHEFEYSQFPARYLTSFVGFLLYVGSASILYCAELNVSTRQILFPAVISLALALLAASSAIWWGTDKNPFLRRKAINLIAESKVGVEKGSGEDVNEPAGNQIVLMAHLDSKSQPVAMITRVLAICASSVVWVAVLALFFMNPAIGMYSAGWIIALYVLGLLGLFAGTVIMFCTVGQKGTGALDNASGVAAVIEAAKKMTGANVKVVITSAEELGLAGAKALLPVMKGWVQSATYGTKLYVLNCDTIDDVSNISRKRISGRARQRDESKGPSGKFVLFSKDPSVCPISGVASDVARNLGLTITTRRMIPGVLTDSVVLSNAGINAVTLSGGSWSTLRRIHTRLDTLEHINGTSINDAADVLVGLATILNGKVSIVH